jgi:hypothetical protein
MDPGAGRSPPSSLLCSPPTSRCPSASTPVVPCLRPTSAGCCFLAGAARAPLDARPQEIADRLPLGRIAAEETSGSPRLLGRPCVRAVVEHLAGRVVASPTVGGGAAAFGSSDTLGDPGMTLSLAAFPRPTRLRAYASPVSLPAPAQGSLPACWAQLWPDGTLTRWTTSRDFKAASPPPFLLDQHCLVAPEPVIRAIRTEDVRSQALSKQARGSQSGGS